MKITQLNLRECDQCGVPLKRKRTKEGKLETREAFAMRPTCRMCLSGHTCLVPSCERKPHSRGYCPSHYQRKKSHGHPEAISLICVPNRDRVWKPINPPV